MKLNFSFLRKVRIKNFIECRQIINQNEALNIRIFDLG